MSTETPPVRADQAAAPPSGAAGPAPGQMVELDVWISALGRMSAAHPDMARILHVVDRLQDRPYRSHVLLCGEPGTGKEGLAKLLHRMMHPGGGPCERVSLLGRTPEQIFTDLFGSGGGGSGAFAKARGGTLILDEILALPPDAQRRLHELISVTRWTERSAESVVVMGLSDGDVGLAVQSGALRHDLAFKLGRILITVPPLRERPEDLSHAALWTANRILRSRGIHRGAELIEVKAPGDSTEVAAVTADPESGVPEPYRVSSLAVAALGHYPVTSLGARTWPGNFRELEAVLERAILLYSDGEVLRAADVERSLIDSLALNAKSGSRT